MGCLVSIHPMCRFKISAKSLTKHLKVVSIHPMCRFKPNYRPLESDRYSFNTSYVSVQVLVTSPLENHRTCFNTSYVSVQGDIGTVSRIVDGFQYILCVGSRSRILLST